MPFCWLSVMVMAPLAIVVGWLPLLLVDLGHNPVLAIVGSLALNLLTTGTQVGSSGERHTHIGEGGWKINRGKEGGRFSCDPMDHVARCPPLGPAQ
jgi:hypothetical protein